jgi:hypothetical protein
MRPVRGSFVVQEIAEAAEEPTIREMTRACRSHGLSSQHPNLSHRLHSVSRLLPLPAEELGR